MKLEELRRSVSDEERAIIDEIWNHYVYKDSWISAIALYQKFKREEAQSMLSSLGGSIVCVSRGNGERDRFTITFLGSLLTTTGPAIAFMFIQYLTYIRDRLGEDSELKEVDGTQVREKLQFDVADSKVFVKALQLSPFSGGGSFGELTWTSGIPRDADELFSDKSIQEYFETRALQNYHPSTPTDCAQKMHYLNLNSFSNSKRLLNEISPKNRSTDSYDVFLSYASKDEEHAHDIANSIRDAGGNAFMSAKHLKPGDVFEDKIKTALTSSTEVWLLLTPSSLKSEWVKREMWAAWILDKPIIPILLDCQPQQAPDLLRKLQWIKFERFQMLVEDRFSKNEPFASKRSGITKS
jgi:hypothetical protein